MKRQNSKGETVLKLNDDKPTKSSSGCLSNDDVTGSSPSKFGNRNKRVCYTDDVCNYRCLLTGMRSSLY